MAISFDCPNCHSTLKGPDEYAGRTAKCKASGTKVTIPTPGAESPIGVSSQQPSLTPSPPGFGHLKGKIAKLTAKAHEHLDPGETPVAVVMGVYETKILGIDSVRTGVFLATDRRLVFFATKVWGFDLEVFPYSNISSFEMSKGFMGHALSFFASGNKVRMKWISEGDFKHFMQYVKDRMGRKETTAPSNAQPDIADQLAKLGQLRDSGILTDSEFEQKKKELLARM